MIARQTWAILLDSYRELNAKKLFWITLILSGLIVAVFGAIGVNESGMSILWWTIEIPELNSNTFPPELFYKVAFLNLGIGIWLTWIAMILALVSTAGIFPDLIASGSIDLLLSKPISRTRLFLTKYVAGLLFVILQVGVFSLASFLVIGLRGGAWEPSLFLAVPIVTLMFSYLFGLMVLLGVVTRSTVASLLLTILIWALIGLIHGAESGLLMPVIQSELREERHVEVIARTEEKLSDLEAELADLRIELGVPEPEPEPRPAPEAVPTEQTTDDRSDGGEETERFAAGPAEAAEPDAPAPIRTLERRISSGEAYLAKLEEGLDEARRTRETRRPWHRLAMTTKLVLPKTSETVALLQRWMIDLAELPRSEDDAPEIDDEALALFGSGGATEDTGPRSARVSQEDVQFRMMEVIQDRSVAWIIGTSLGFEAVMVAIAALIFRRRDF